MFSYYYFPYNRQACPIVDIVTVHPKNKNVKNVFKKNI